MQKMGCSGFVRRVLDIVSILLLILSKITLQNNFFRFLLEANIAYVS